MTVWRTSDTALYNGQHPPLTDVCLVLVSLSFKAQLRFNLLIWTIINNSPRLTLQISLLSISISCLFYSIQFNWRDCIHIKSEFFSIVFLGLLNKLHGNCYKFSWTLQNIIIFPSNWVYHFQFTLNCFINEWHFNHLTIELKVLPEVSHCKIHFICLNIFNLSKFW